MPGTKRDERFGGGGRGVHVFIFNPVFQRRALVIKMMNVGGRVFGRAGVNVSFPKHNSATIRNILMVLGRIIEQVNANCRCKNDNSDYLGFLITSP